MNNKAILITIPVVAILLASVINVSNVYAESNAKRYNDGYSNGSEAAARDSTYNVACDPTGAHTSDGQHSTTYCTGWAIGYVATWNANHGGQATQQYTGGPVYPQPQRPSLTTQAYNACVQHLGICTAVLKVEACSLFGVCI